MPYEPTKKHDDTITKPTLAKTVVAAERVA